MEREERLTRFLDFSFIALFNVPKIKKTLSTKAIIAFKAYSPLLYRFKPLKIQIICAYQACNILYNSSKQKTTNLYQKICGFPPQNKFAILLPPKKGVNSGSN